MGPRVRGGAEVAALIGPVLGWDDETAKREVEHYLRQVEAERHARSETDDAGAAAARLRAAAVLFEERTPA